MRFTVIGCGNGAFATAIDLSSQGHSVTLYSDPSHSHNFEKIIEKGAITGYGKGPVGDIRIDKITCNEKEAFGEQDMIIVTTPANAHEEVVREIAPYLRDGDRILLSPGGTGGALIFSQMLSDYSDAKDLKIGEFHTLPYTARKEGKDGVRILLMVRFLLFAAFPAVDNDEMYGIVKSIYPHTVLANDVLETSLNNGNATTHPAPVVLNAGKIEYYEKHNHYAEGITPSVAKVIQLIDDERKSICRALGYEEIDIKDRLHWMGYCPPGETVYESIQGSKDVFLPVKGPDHLHNRYLTEDTPSGLVFMSSLADKAGVETPLMDSVINLASALMSEDYMNTGRTMDKVGLGHLEPEELREYLRTGKTS